MEGRGAGTGGLSTRRTVTEGPEYLPGSWYNSALQLGRFWGLQVTLAIVSCREPSRAGRWSPTASKVQQAPHRRSAGCGRSELESSESKQGFVLAASDIELHLLAGIARAIQCGLPNLARSGLGDLFEESSPTRF